MEFHITVTTESLHDFDVRELEQVSHEKAKFKSFKLAVPSGQYKLLFNDELWPEGVMVRKYITPREESTDAQTSL